MEICRYFILRCHIHVVAPCRDTWTLYVAAALIKVDIALQAVACGAIALSCVHFG